MSSHETAKTQFIIANGTKLAYRRLGPSSGIPLVMLIHFRGNMDFWDPLLINTLIKARPVILVDIAGTGKSSGLVPNTMADWAGHAIELLKALSIPQIDLLGFSMGGVAVQYVAINAPGLVRRLILAGTRTSTAPHTVLGPREWFLPLAKSETEEEFRKAWTDSFFNHTAHGRAAADASWLRIMTRKEDRSPHLSPKLAKRQAEAISTAGPSAESKGKKIHPYERLQELNMPVFIANGDNDLLIPTQNSIELAKLLPNAHLHIYPNAGHGFLFQYAELFAAHVNLFLDGPDGGEVTLVSKL